MPDNNRTYSFDGFRVDAHKRLLTRDGQTVTLSSKAFDLLLALIENAGREISKEELMGRIWADQMVEDANLTVTMSQLRKALGEKASDHRFIVTIPGRGYRFVGVPQRTEALIVEQHTVSQIVIDELDCVEKPIGAVMQTSATPNGDGDASPAIALRRFSARPILLLIAFAFALAIGGAVWWVRARYHASLASPAWSKVTLHRFVTQGGVPYRVAISPDGRSLVYRQRINGRDSLWLGQVADNSSVMIRDDPDVSYNSLAFAPDGQSVYSTERLLSEPQTRLVRVPLLGGVATELTAKIDSGVTFSPNGSQIAFLRNDRKAKQSALMIANAGDGQSERVVSTVNGPQGFTGGLSWAPDGKSIAVAANTGDPNHNEILSIRVADGVREKIGTAAWGIVGQLAWLHDQSGLLVTNRENAIARKSQIWFVPYPTGEPRKISNELDIYQGNSFSASTNGRIAVLRGHLTSEIRVAPGNDVTRSRSVYSGVEPGYEAVDGLAWTPEGRLLYSAYVGDSQAIWQVDGDGRNARQLTTNKADLVDRRPSVTSDGRYLVFQSNRSGSFQIWRANANGTNLKQLTYGGANLWPSVSPDGRFVVYACVRETESRICRVGIDGGDPTQLTEGSGTRPVVSPDGKYIAYFEPSSPQVRITVVAFAGGAALKIFEVANTVFASDLVWAPDGKSIIYRDGFLGVWRQSFDEKPTRFPGFEDKEVYQFAWSADGKSLAYSTGLRMQEIVLIERAN